MFLEDSSTVDVTGSDVYSMCHTPIFTSLVRVICLLYIVRN